MNEFCTGCADFACRCHADDDLGPIPIGLIVTSG